MKNATNWIYVVFLIHHMLCFNTLVFPNTQILEKTKFLFEILVMIQKITILVDMFI